MYVRREREKWNKTFIMVPFFEVSKIHKKDMTVKMENVFYYENSELHDFLGKMVR